MLSPPECLPPDTLARALGRGWNLTVVTIEYRAVGFGSHHWEAVDTGGSRWFVTVDELGLLRHRLDEPMDAPLGRLRAALSTAIELRDAGHRFVVAPAPTGDGAPLLEMDGEFALALYPFVAGRSFDWGPFPTEDHRRGVLTLLVDLHGVPNPHALTEDFSVPHRDELELSLREDADRGDAGPYAARTAALMKQSAPAVEDFLAHFDAQVDRAKGTGRPMVLTHGEPHPGNTMSTPDGWLLVDWDTVLVAPPERDLWLVAAGDDALLRAYADATGTTPDPEMMALYRTRWDVAEMAVFVSRFGADHGDGPDDRKSWDALRAMIEGLRR